MIHDIAAKYSHTSHTLVTLACLVTCKSWAQLTMNITETSHG